MYFRKVRRFKTEPVLRRDTSCADRWQHDAIEPLLYPQLTHVAETNQLTTGALLWVAVAKVPHCQSARKPNWRHHVTGNCCVLCGIIFSNAATCSRDTVHNTTSRLCNYIILQLSSALTSSSAIAERQRDARVTSIRKIAKWNFWATLLGGGLRGNVDASCVRHSKKRGRPPICDNWGIAEELRSGVFGPPFGGLRGKVGALSISHSKVRDRLPISDKWTFS